MGAFGVPIMADPCAWLPALVTLSDYHGDWDIYREVIYEHFRTDFLAYIPKFTGKPCRVNRAPLVDGKEPTFWHIITEGKEEENRIPDLRRCERIRWPRPMIEQVPCAHVNSWRVRRGKKWRINLAPTDFSYLVVLAEKSNSVFLITTFHVERDHRRRKLKAEWEKGKLEKPTPPV
jgi:hypothetical protein